jgi:transcriptional regulator with XRE-family HTH domain
MGTGTTPFADLLRGFRDRAELTQEELAKRAGISLDAVGLLERGERRRPHATTVARLAAALELSAAARTQFETAARHPASLVAHAPATTLPLLTTKLTIPPPGPNLVPRPHLITHLQAGVAGKLTLIAAPAGFGKTTLLSA